MRFPGPKFIVPSCLIILAGLNSFSCPGDNDNPVEPAKEYAWAALGSGMDLYVSVLAVYDGDLIAGGGFTTAGGKKANRIAV